MKLKLELPVTGITIVINTETKQVLFKSHDFYAGIPGLTDENGFEDVSEFLEVIE